jgi:hypothetical protein
MVIRLADDINALRLKCVEVIGVLARDSLREKNGRLARFGRWIKLAVCRMCAEIEIHGIW